MTLRMRPLSLAKETLLPLGEDSLRAVQGGMPPVGGTDDCPSPVTEDCTYLSACCLTKETGSTTSVNHPTLTP